MGYILVGASLTLALVALARANPKELGDATYYLLVCLAYGFAPAAVGYMMAFLNRLVGKSHSRQDFIADRNWGWIIFLAILAAGQAVQAARG